ncbi:peptidyl-prolyl cis-trans isomerase, cyclophilin-type [Ancylostoma caninum]|uniref:Peptidyl-prolyl cis-trans isomerase, cyclophilin-type n=1 Tax=Ancylostoma caninum TaxID=29170 RepID=A0A368FRB8_ANCCA|nr:peptidyl-prolyl cis-trans isomerase, cyclophilin-type [Ancylostoma caninum]
MTSLLGLICEATAPVSDMRTRTPIPYCAMDPWVFIEVGFAGGAAVERIEARMDRKASSKLVENFVALCKGDGPSFEMGIRPNFNGSPLFAIDSKRGIISTGDYVLKNGCGGRSATLSGTVYETDIRTGPASAGSIVMLPLDTDPTAYNSIFCILTKDVPYIEGKVIGKVTKGLDSLKYIVWRCGTASGVPKEALEIQACGQL